MTAIIDQQIEFQNLQASNSNMRTGPMDRRKRRAVLSQDYLTNSVVYQSEEYNWPLCRRTAPFHDRRSVVSKFERDMLLA